MASVYFISDLHLGHKRILDFSKDQRKQPDVATHDKWIVDSWNSVVTKRDVIYCLGDIAFSKQGLELCHQLNGIKKAILGNHDGFTIEEYQAAGFIILPSIYRYKEWWLTHCPIHPAELRGKKNIHGHVHNKTIPDNRYINVCVEAVNGKPISIDEIRNMM